MKRILVLGAGFSAPYLVHHLLHASEERDWFVTVGDLDADRAKALVGSHPKGQAIPFDVTDLELRDRWIGQASVVISMLTPTFHQLVALDCIEHGVPLVTASYVDSRLKDLEGDAVRKEVLLLGEMGLDPGLDHMSAMALVERVRGEGGRIEAFRSYGSGLPSADTKAGPLRYAITWNPWNVVTAGSAGAQYIDQGKIRCVPHARVFWHTWEVDVEGVGRLEAYANRDSLTYLEAFGMEGLKTMIRGTLRWPGWSETWSIVVRLGLANSEIEIPRLSQRSYRDLVETFLPLNVVGSSVEQRLAAAAGISPTGRIMDNLRWLGLFEDRPIPVERGTAADALTALVSDRLALAPGGRDMVILQHELDVVYDGSDRPPERVVSRMVDYGVPGGFTAMSRTVGLPAALAAELILEGEIELVGVQIPTHPAIYGPVLARAARAGLHFEESTRPWDGTQGGAP